MIVFLSGQDRQRGPQNTQRSQSMITRNGRSRRLGTRNRRTSEFCPMDEWPLSGFGRTTLDGYENLLRQEHRQLLAQTPPGRSDTWKVKITVDQLEGDWPVAAPNRPLLQNLVCLPFRKQPPDRDHEPVTRFFLVHNGAPASILVQPKRSILTPSTARS